MQVPKLRGMTVTMVVADADAHPSARAGDKLAELAAELLEEEQGVPIRFQRITVASLELDLGGLDVGRL